ncbi:helix-turn-helix transcriptional regulator [Cupriavidus metallidurans]|nr:AlpA family transcriptional regulator [Cupriavidus metallidurans]
MAEQALRRVLRLPAVTDMVGLSRSSIYARIQAGTFPSPIKMGHSSGWIESEIQEWIDRQIAVTRNTS